MVEIKQVTNKKMLKEFVKIPWTLKIYENDPNWIPPIIHDVKNMLNPEKGYFYEIGDVALFIAYRDGKPAGRISAHINHLYEEKYDNDTGFFGFYEAIDDMEVSKTLFSTAENWLKNKGKTVMQGPQSFSIYDEIGFEVHGKDVMPVIGLFHYANYYEKHAVEYGLGKKIDWSCYLVTDIGDYQPYLKDIRENIMKEQEDVEYFIYEKKDKERRRKEVIEIFNKAWDGNWGHLPLTDKQYKNLFDELIMIANPELCIFAEKAGKTVGFIISIPDVNPYFRILNGHLYPWRLVRFLMNYKKTKKIRTIIMGLLPEYRGQKIDDVFYLRTIEDGIKLGYKASDCSLIVETNKKMIGALKPLKADQYKTYRIFEKKIK